MCDHPDKYKKSPAHDHLLDKTGFALWCENEGCEAPAVKIVPVSENAAHDSFRGFCAACENAYTIGVQHGRFHEAEQFGNPPGRDSATTPRDKNFGFKPGDVVKVDNPRYHGPGVVCEPYPPAHLIPVRVRVLLESGNTWDYAVETIAHAKTRLPARCGLRREARRFKLKLNYRG